MADIEQKQIGVLLVEDNIGDAFLLQKKLANNPDINFQITHVERLAQAIEELRRKTVDLVLLDLNLSDSYGLETFLVIEKIAPHLPIILLTGVNNESLALNAVRHGAQDYLIKEKVTTEILIRSVNYAIERMHHLAKIYQSEVRLQRENEELVQQVEKHTFELENRNRELKKLFLLATIDRVTGIANRYHFDEFIQREWNNGIRNQIPLSIIMIDIDLFKLYNDTYGHPAGDICLRKVAQTIKSSVQRPKDMAARYGGEEFVVCLSGVNLQGAMFVAENIRSQVRALSIPYSSNDNGGRLTISLGVSNTIPQLNSFASSLIKAADKALYIAKQRGRDRVEMYQI